MPDRNSANDHSLNSSMVKELEPTMVTAAANTPATYFQQLSDVPSGLKVVVEPLGLQLTNRSIRRAIKRNATIAMHWLNVPFVDPLVSVSRIYKTLDVLSFNYEREHTDAFWMQYPDAIIRSDAEQAISLNDAWCRANRKKLCKRFAHYAFQYLETSKLQVASLLNLNILTRLNGTEPLKQIASDVRWSYINTRCNMYERFPKAKGVESLMIDSSAYALGKSTYGSDIVSFPLWATDIFGNRGMHAQHLTELLNEARSNTEDPSMDMDNVSAMMGFASAIEDVLAKQYCVNSMIDGDEVTYRSCVRASKPFAVRAENTATFVAAVMQEGEDEQETAPTTKAAYSKLSDSGTLGTDDTWHSHTYLTRSVWNAYQYWTEYMLRYFSAMSDPYSDVTNIMTNLLGLVQHSMKIEDVNKAVRAVKNVDIAELATRMTYKRDNAVNTATFIKFAPFIYKAPASADDPINLRDASQFDIMSDDVHPAFAAIGINKYSIFATNFERYDVDSDNITAAIMNAKVWPHLNPSMIGHLNNKLQAPYVLNPSITACDLFKKEGYDDRLLSPTGIHASFLDYALAYSHNPNESEIASAGVDVATFERFASTPSNNIIVFDECPDTFFALSQPIIDPTDIYQCGFNVMISANDDYPNEFETILIDPARYTGDTTGDNITEDHEKVSLIGSDPAAPSIKLGANETAREHVVNPGYRQLMQTLFVFVGTGIFNHPIASIAAINSDYYSMDIDCSNDHASDFLDTFLSGSAHPILATYIDAIKNGSLFSQKSIQDGELTSSIAALSVAGTDSKNKVVSIFTFAPDYPPVLIARQYSSAANNGSVPVIPMYNNVSYVGSDAVNDNAAIGTKVLPRFDCSHADTGDAASPFIATKKRTIYNQRNLALKSMLFFLRYFKFPVPKVYGDGQAYDDPQGPFEFVFHTMSDWLIQMSGRAKAIYPGLRDTIPFWDKLLKVEMAQKVTIPTGAEMPTNDVLVPARTLVASGAKAKSDYTNRRNTSKPSVGNVKTGSFVTKDSKKGNHSNSKRHNRMKDDKDLNIDSDGINDRSEDAYLKENNVNARNDSPLNQTDKKSSKFISDSNASPLSGGDVLKSV